MKRRYLVVLMVMLITLLFSSCSDIGQNVYYGGISGKVSDLDTKQGVSGVQVYVYTSESEWENAYKKWEENGGKYSDNSALYRASTSSDGKWTVSKIVWRNKKGAWGDDYDHTSVWITYFSEDYGCWREDEKVELVSGTSNTNAIETLRRQEKQSSKITLNFRDEKNKKNINDEITFTYSYFDGYRTVEANASTTNGQFTINISCKKNAETDFKVTSIKAPNDCWEPKTEISIGKIEDASISEDISLKRKAYDMKEGISGTISASRNAILDTDGKSLVHSLDGLIVKAKIGDKPEVSVISSNGNYDGECARSFSVSFSGLLINEIIPSDETITLSVFDGGKELATKKFNLENNYDSRNNFSIILSDTAWD